MAQNIELVPGDRPGQAGLVDRLLADTGLEDARHLYASRRSMGMGRRVALDRAFVVRPELVLMDEPLVTLDAPTAHRLRLLLLEIWRSSWRAIGATIRKRSRPAAPGFWRLIRSCSRARAEAAAGPPLGAKDPGAAAGRAGFAPGGHFQPPGRALIKASPPVPGNPAPRSESDRPSPAVSPEFGQDFYISH